MSITTAQRTRLGIFMLIGAMLLLFFLAIPLAFKLTKKTVQYYSFYEGESLSGLSNGADVKFHGVVIGKVSDINIDEDDLTQVKVMYEIRDDFPMKKDMYASSGFLGITGLLYVEIMGGTNESEPLPPNSEIRTEPSLMAAITGKADNIITKLELTINKLNTLNMDKINETLENVANITGTVQGAVDSVAPHVSELTSAAKGTMKNVEKITSDIEKISSEVSAEIDMKQIGTMISRIDSTAQAMASLSEGLDLTVRQSREDVAIVMEDMKEAMENANELTRILMENPSLILKGDQQRERKIK